MPNDPLAHVSRGERLDISADKANAWTGAARDYLKRKHDGGARTLADRLTPSLEVDVRNDTGADLPERSVVRVADWVVDARDPPLGHPFEVADRPVLKGTTPTDDSNLIAILHDPIPSNRTGRAILMGAAVVDLLVNDSAHGWANPINGDSTRLGTATAGVARILKKDGTRALVMLGDGGGGSVYGRAKSSPALPGSGPRPTINLLRAAPTVGNNIDITLNDDSTDNELEFTFDNLGIFGRAQDGAEGTGGPRRRLNLSKTAQSMGTNLTVVLTDDSGNDELDYVFENLGMFARKGAGSTVGPQPRFSFVEGTGASVSITVAEDGASDEIDVTLALSGDSAAPGNSYYYGTDSGGTKGWFVLPAGGIAVTDTSTIDLTLTGSDLTAVAVYQISITADASGLKLSGDVAAPGNNYFYGTNGAGTKCWALTPFAGDPGDLTDSIGAGGGTVDGTLQDLPDPADTPASADALRDDLVANVLPVIRNWGRELLTQLNTICQAMRDSTPPLMV